MGAFVPEHVLQQGERWRGWYALAETPDPSRWTASDPSRWTASQMADFCRHYFSEYREDLTGTTPRAAITGVLLDRHRITPPTSRHGWEPERLRLECPTWWAHQLKRRNIREAEYQEIAAGTVRKYCSDTLLQAAAKNHQRLQEWIDRAGIENTEGERLPLRKVVNASTANKTNRRNELMTRITGMEFYFRLLNWRGMFITITAPASNHRNKGARWNKASPKEVSQTLGGQWAKFRALMAKHGLDMAGLRIAEPHADGCPHWHILAWFPDGQTAARAVKYLRDCFLFHEGPPEPGAARNRLQFATVNPAKGEAAGYIAKYVSKNIDGEHVSDSTDSGQAVSTGTDGAARVRAWASAWGIRQFQFFGTPPVGLWRELRRLRDLADVPPELSTVWAMADAGHYGGFLLAVDAMGDTLPKLAKHTFAHELAELADQWGGVDAIPDGEIAKAASLNRYNEPRDKVRGLAMAEYSLITRRGTWTLTARAAEPTPATAQDRVTAYATVTTGAKGYTDWADVMAFAGQVGLFKEGGKVLFPPRTRGKNCNQGGQNDKRTHSRPVRKKKRASRNRHYSAEGNAATVRHSGIYHLPHVQPAGRDLPGKA